MCVMMKLHDLRNDYDNIPFEEKALNQHPMDLFKQWFKEASDVQAEPNACCLSTYDPIEKKLSSRIVLMKEIQEQGIVFFTNYDSRKGKNLLSCPQAAINFYWPGLFRQVRLEGMVRKILKEESKQYFDSRPRESRISAIISQQSRPLNSRNELERQFHQACGQWDEEKIQRPEYWGGYLFEIHTIEFWLGMRGRLHDRLVFTCDSPGQWGQGQRLYP